jgi:S1-C subfamily serine protease
MTHPEPPTTPPDWIQAPFPWSQAPLGPSAAIPTDLAGSPQRGRSVAFAATAVMALVGLVVGIGAGSLASRHGARPTLNATSTPSASTGVLPAPSAPLDPTPGPGSSDPTTGSGRGSSAPTPQSAAIAAKVDPGIVDINTTDSFASGAGAGTGMVLTSSGEILTNNHVIDGATNISVTSVTSGKTYRAAVVGTDPTEDIAVLSLSGASGLSPIPLGNSSSVAVGDSVVAIGNAGGAGGTPSVVTGAVQAVNQTITASDVGGANPETLNGLLETDAPIQPGDSGGPLVNTSGEVIGIDTAASVGRRFSAGASEGFAIPIERALNVVKQIEAGKASATVHLGLPGFLGVSISPARSSSAGAVVAAVVPGLPAAAAGVHAGDTITALDSTAVDSAQALSTLTRQHRPGDRVVLVWTDAGGGSHTATVTLGTGPAD